MVACPHCRSLNEPGRPICGKCGSVMGPAPDFAKQTLLGIANVGTAPAGNAPLPVASAQTQVGHAPPAAVPPTVIDVPAQPPVGPGGHPPRYTDGSSPSGVATTEPDEPAIKQTMMGIAPAAHGPPVASASPASADTPGSELTTTRRLQSEKPTMMGTPRLGSLAPGLGTDAPHQPLSDRPHLGHQLERPQEEAHRPAPVSVSDMETILRPSSDPKEEAVRRVAWREPARRQRPSATKPERERKAEPRGIEPTTEDLAVLPRSRKLSKSAWLGLAGAGGTVAVLATLFALWPTAPDIAGAVKTDADGKEKLELTCQGCPDGSTLSVGGVRGSVRGKVTELDAASTLHVGKNEVDVVVEREGGDRDEVPIEVFVNYRIRGDFSGLDASRPKFDVNVEAVPDTVVVVDGKPVKLDSSGKGRVEIDVTKDLTGPKAKMSKLVRAVPYSATASGMEKEEGAVTLSTLVTPLVVTAPGSRTVIGGAHFMLAGKTDQRGTVTVSGRPITVDAQGRFAQLMNVSAVGETTITVRATSPKQAPRLVPIHVKRVQNLSAEAARFRKQATTLYSAIRADLASKKGWKVALTGAVAEIRQADHATVILMNVEDGCERPPCQARLVYGRSTKVAMGSRVEAFGRVIGAHRSRRGDIPDVSVDFLVHAGSP